MKFIQITESCDMTRAVNSEHVAADETLYIALGTDPKNLKIRELDLTADWAKALREATAPFLAASHEPGQVSTPGSELDGRTRANDPRVRGYNDSMRAWAETAGYRVTTLAKGGYYYPAKTRNAYARHLAGETHLLTGKNKLQPDYDPQAGNLA